MKETAERELNDDSNVLAELAGRLYIQKRLEEMISEGSIVASLYDKESHWFHKGVGYTASSNCTNFSIHKPIMADVQNHTLNMNPSGLERNRVLDLNDEGERWEGDVLHDQPYGWGMLYDKEGEIAYEGFRIGDVSVCYGTQYYADIGVKEYEGNWFEGKRWGRGKLYDRNGVVVFDGEWLNDYHLETRVVITEENQQIHSRIEELIVSDESCNDNEWKVLDFSLMPYLKRLEVGSNCFFSVKVVKMIGLEKLERVVIGKRSFTRDEQMQHKSCFALKHCPQVKELRMGRYSFSDFSVCEIDNLASLEVIEMGELNEWSANFKYASLELKSDGDGMK